LQTLIMSKTKSYEVAFKDDCVGLRAKLYSYKMYNENGERQEKR